MRTFSRVIASLFNVIGVLLIIVGLSASILSSYFSDFLIKYFISIDNVVIYADYSFQFGVLLLILAVMFKYGVGAGFKIFLVLFVRRLVTTLLLYALLSSTEETAQSISSISQIYTLSNVISWIVSLIISRKIIKNS